MSWFIAKRPRKSVLFRSSFCSDREAFGKTSLVNSRNGISDSLGSQFLLRLTTCSRFFCQMRCMHWNFTATLMWAECQLNCRIFLPRLTTFDNLINYSRSPKIPHSARKNLRKICFLIWKYTRFSNHPPISRRIFPKMSNSCKFPSLLDTFHIKLG